MAYQIYKNIGGQARYRISNDGKTAEFDTTNSDPIKSPIEGEISKKTDDLIQIKDSEGNKFDIENLNSNLNTGQNVKEGETIGTAKGRVKLSIFSSGIFGSKQKVDEFLNFKTNEKETEDKNNKEQNKTAKKDLPAEKELWRVPIETYYAPIGMAVDVMRGGLKKMYDKVYDDKKGKEYISDEEQIDESLMEEIKRIKKLLK
jgi:hypothetical protein